MDLTYVSNRVTFFQSITNNGLTIMSSEKRSLTPIYLCPCHHCHYCIYSDYHLIEQQSLSHYMLFRNPFIYSQRNPFSKLLQTINTKIIIILFMSGSSMLTLSLELTCGVWLHKMSRWDFYIEYGFQFWSFVDDSSNRWTVKLMGLLSTAWAGTQVLRSELVMVCCSWAFELCIIATFQNVNEIFCFCNSVTTCTQGNLDRGVPGTNSRGKS